MLFESVASRARTCTQDLGDSTAVAVAPSPSPSQVSLRGPTIRLGGHYFNKKGETKSDGAHEHRTDLWPQRPFVQVVHGWYSDKIAGLKNQSSVSRHVCCDCGRRNGTGIAAL